MKYLIALDLDGTLLNDKSLLTKKTIKTVNELKEEHMVILVTGRPYLTSINFYEELELNTPFINDNGGSISNPKDPKFKEINFPISGNDIITILDKTKDYVVSALYTYKDDLYAYKYNEDLANAFLADTSSVIKIDKSINGHEPGGMVFMIYLKDMKAFEDSVKSTSPNLTYRLWGKEQGFAFYEVYQKGVSKMKAIKEVLKLYPEIDKVIAFGDDINDIEMLNFADVGVRMKNSLRLTNGTGTTTSEYTNDEDGVAKFLKSYFEK